MRNSGEASTRPDLTTRSAVVLVTVLTGVNLVLALHDLTRSLWIDEGASWLIASQHGAMFLHSVDHEGGDMLLYYAVLHVSVTVFGSGPMALRLPSVIAGAAAVPVVYALGRRAIGTRLAGVSSAALMAAALALVFWQQNARAYSLDVTLAAATTLTWLHAVRDRRRGAMVAWVVLTTAAIYTHPLALLVVISQVPVVLVARPDRALVVRVGAALAAVAVLCVPFAVIATHRGTGQIDWLGRPRPGQIRDLVEALAGSGSGGLVVPDHPWLADATVVAWVVAVVALALRYARRGPTADLVGVTLVVSCLVVPPVVAYVASFVVQPVFLTRYLLICLPAAIVLAVAGCRALGPRPVAGAVMVALVVAHLVIAVPAYRGSVEPDAQDARYVVAHSRPGDCITFYANPTRVVYDYYLRRWHRSGPTQVLPASSTTVSLSALKTLNDVPSALTTTFYTEARIRSLVGCRRLWLIDGHFGSPFVTGTRAEYEGYLRLLPRLAERWPNDNEIVPSLHLFSTPSAAG